MRTHGTMLATLCAVLCGCASRCGTPVERKLEESELRAAEPDAIAALGGFWASLDMPDGKKREESELSALERDVLASLGRLWARKFDWTGLDLLPEGAEREFKEATRVLCTASAERDSLPLYVADKVETYLGEDGREHQVLNRVIGPKRSALLAHAKRQLPHYEQALSRFAKVASAPEAAQWADDAKYLALVTCWAVSGTLAAIARDSKYEKWGRRSDQISQEFLAEFARPKLEKWTLSVCPIDESVKRTLLSSGIGDLTPRSKAIRCEVRVSRFSRLLDHGDLPKAHGEVESLEREGIPRERLSTLEWYLDAYRRRLLGRPPAARP